MSGLRRKTRQTSELIVSHSTLRSRRTTGVVWYDLGVNKVGLQSVFSSFSPLSSKRSFAAVLLCAALFFSLLPSSQGVLADDGQTTEPSEPRISEGFEPSVKLPAVLVLDSSLRSELYAKNSEIVLEIPAVSRLMTLYLASERLAADDMIPISKDAARISEFEDHIDIPLREGDSFPVRYMLLRLMFQQSDAAAVALAEKIAGSRREFVSEMQKTAMMLGMSQTTIHRCDVVRAERESSIASEIADAAAILEEHIAQNASGAPALPEASDRVSTAKTTLETWHGSSPPYRRMRAQKRTPSRRIDTGDAFDRRPCCRDAFSGEQAQNAVRKPYHVCLHDDVGSLLLGGHHRIDSRRHLCHDVDGIAQPSEHDTADFATLPGDRYFLH